MTATTSKLGADMTDEQIVELTKQITGWTTHFAIPQEPHGHFYAGHHHQASVDDILRLARVLLARQPAAIDKEAAIRDRARWFVRDFSRDVGFAMSDAQAEVMLNLFLRYAAPLTNEASKPADYSPCCDAPAFCSSVRRCTAKDTAAPSVDNMSIAALKALHALAGRAGYKDAFDALSKMAATAKDKPAAPSVEQGERGAFEAAWSKVYDTGDFLLRHYSITEQYVNHDTQRAWEGWKLRAASPSANVAHGAEAIKSAYRQGFMAGWNGEGEAISAPPSAPPAQPALTDDARDAARYRWLRRRAFMLDESDDSVTTISLFKAEGPAGEFLDDQIDAALTAAQSASGDTK